MAYAVVKICKEVVFLSHFLSHSLFYYAVIKKKKSIDVLDFYFNFSSFLVAT